jgi:hypothetical protein
MRVRCQVPQRWKQGAAGVCGLSYKMSMCLNGDCRRTIKQYHFVFAVVTLSSDSKQLIPPGCLVQLILCKPHQPSVLSHGISGKYFNASGSSHMLSSRWLQTSLLGWLISSACVSADMSSPQTRASGSAEMVPVTCFQSRFGASRVLSIVIDKGEQLSGRNVLFTTIMDPFSLLSSWASPQVWPVKLCSRARFFRARHRFTQGVKRAVSQLAFSHFTISVSPFHN